MTTNANRSQFQIHRFCFLHLHAGILLLGSMFFKIIFAPFVEIDVWYKFVHNLLISERISNITRHKCSKFSALQYHKSDSRYQSNDLTPYIQSAPRRRAVQHFVFKVGIRSTYICVDRLMVMSQIFYGSINHG